MVMTVVEGLVAPARVGGLEQAYREATEQLPPGMVETFLVRATERPSVLRTVSLWADRDALDAMRASAPTPKGVQIFQDARTPAPLLTCSSWTSSPIGGARAAPMRSDLSLHEQVLLLSLRDDTGKQTGGTWPAIAIAGALLSELWLAERITLEKPKRTVLVTVSNRALTGEGIVDEALQTLSRAKRRAALSTWVTRLSGTKKLVHRVTEPLVRRGILKRERAPFLLFFERTVFPTVNPGPERRLIDELGQAIRMDTDPGEVPTRTRLILGIADSTGLLRANFDKKELKRLKRRIQSLKEADPFAQAVGTAVAGIASG